MVVDINECIISVLHDTKTNNIPILEDNIFLITPCLVYVTNGPIAIDNINIIT